MSPEILIPDATSSSVFPLIGELTPSSGVAPAPEVLPTILISSSEEVDILWVGRTPAAKRVCKIVPDPVWMTSDPILTVGDVITLALFDDAVFDAEISNVTRYPNGGVGMTAHLRSGNGTVYLSYHERSLTVSVETSSGADFSIEVRNGIHYAVEIDRANSDVLEGAEPEIPLVRDAVADDPTDLDVTAFSVVPGAPVESSIIDVMIVYTPAAQSWAVTNNGIENIINSAMQRANTVHTNSDTQVYMNLVHSEEVNYTEQGIFLDLTNLTFTGGSYIAMDEVQLLRDQYSADMVCLLEKTEDAGGLGWLLRNKNGSSDYAFCVARVQQSAGSSYTVVHEWGHNMGCHHAIDQVVEPGPTFWQNWPENTWSAGWKWEDGSIVGPTFGQCTIMSYENFYNTGYIFERVPYFSNPAVYFEGTYPTGDVADGDNARTIREMSTVIAAYRKAPDLDYDGIPNDWELLYFGGETNANPDEVASNGVNTVLEAYIADLNPTNPASFFTASLTNANGFVVRWNATSGRVYSVFSSADLSDSFQPLETNILWPQASWTDTVGRSESFYQIEVKLAE